MTVVTSPGDVAHPFTVSDLEEMPDDGRRYELIDGELVDPGRAKPWRPDPRSVPPSLTVFELANGDYKQLAHVTGGQSWTASRPFPVRVVPADLVRGLRP